MIPRIMPEWGVAGLTLAAAIVIGLTADSRVGVYLVWSGLSLPLLALAWAGLFAGLGLVQMTVLGLCWRLGTDRDGVCRDCPLANSCGMQRWRPRLALVGAMLWMALAIALAGGDSFLLPALMAAGLSCCEFFIFTLLSVHVPWISSLR